MLKPDRSLYPEVKDGKPVVDLSSGKYVKYWQGPQHPGVTGNMSLELTLAGDEIVDAKTRVGYLHRGFEKLMERRKYMQCFPICVRVCVPEPDTNEYCLAVGTEDLAGITVPEKAQWLRALQLEMARLANLLAWLGGAGGSMGLGITSQWTMYLRDLILDRFEELTGGRIYHMYTLPGGVRSDLPEGFIQRMEESLKEVTDTLFDVETVLLNNAVYKTRTVGVGVIKPEWVDQYGVVGPNARAAGFDRDVRKDYPYLVYDKLDFDVIVGKNSDMYERATLRYKEAHMTVDLIRQILSRMPKNEKDIMAKIPNPLHWKIPKGETYSRTESSRGEFGYYMVSDGSEYPRRIAVRGPSYTHAMALLERMLLNANISDVAGMMVSLHTCPPEIER
jgi:NADH-quinone oxidoreductase subunit D